MAVNQWMLPYLAAMTPQYVEMLLRGMLFGNHVQGMELFTVMIDSSPEIAACVQEYTDGILKKRLVYEPYREEDEEPSDTAIEKAKVVSAAIRNMRPDATRDENGIDGTIKDLAFSRFHGMSVLEADWTDTYGTGERFLKRVPGMEGEVQCLRSTYWVHPICYAFDNTGRMGLSVTQDVIRDSTKSAKVNKGAQRPPVFTNSANNPRENVVMPFPDNNFLIAINKAKTGSVFGASCLRPLAWWWLASNFCGDYLMKYAELFGIPLRKATYDPNTPDKVKAEIRQLLQAAGSEPWTMMPKGAEIEFERASGNGGDSPQAFLFHFANEMIRKVILHQTMSGGTKAAGNGAGKGGMETEHEGPKADCIDAGAKFVESVLNQQLVPAILSLNYGEDGDLEAPTIRLMDYEVGGLADAQRDTALAQIMDVPDGYLRRKYGVPRPATGDKLAGIDVGVLGAQAAVQQQQRDDQMKQAADASKQQAKVSMANANAIAKQTAQMPGAQKPQPSSTDEDDDGSGSMSAKRARKVSALEAGGSDAKSGCLMAMIEGSLEDRLIAWTKANVPQSELTGDGIEDEPHVTILYGFNPDFDINELHELCKSKAMIKLTLGKVSRFECPDYDVIKIDVQSPLAEKLNASIADNLSDSITPSQYDYHPHLTLAYVKKGSCKELDGADDFNGEVITKDKLLYSLPKREGRENVELRGSGLDSRRAIQAASAALQKTVKPVLDKLEAISKIKDKAARIAAYKRFLAEEPKLVAQMKADGALADETEQIATAQFEKGLKARTALQANFNPDQERDSSGRWTDGGSGSMAVADVRHTLKFKHGISRDVFDKHSFNAFGVSKKEYTKEDFDKVDKSIGDAKAARAAEKAMEEKSKPVVVPKENVAAAPVEPKIRPVSKWEGTSEKPASQKVEWKDEGNDKYSVSGVKVVRETDKAWLVSHPHGEDSWLPKSQVKIDGDKATVPGWLRAQKFASSSAEMPVRLVGETDKAWVVGVDPVTVHSTLAPNVNKVFLPKSQVERTGQNTLRIPAWLKSAKEEEVAGHSAHHAHNQDIMW